jgi:hypothetical protein
MLTHTHTRSDYPQPVSPRIPQPPRRKSITTCTPAIEQRVRRILTWHSGGCGLIGEQAADMIVAMLLDGSLTIDDLWKLASYSVYTAVYERWYEILQTRKK